MRKSLIALPVLLLLPLCAEAQDPLQLVQKVAANYAALSKTTYDFERIELMEFKSSSQHQTQRRQRIVGSGGKYREESLPSGPLYLFDGQFNWAYNPDRNEYTKTSARAAALRAPSLSMFEIVGYRAKSARLLRVENLELASGPVVCQVIEVERVATDDRMEHSPTTYWIDVNRSLVLKSRTSYTTRAVDGSTSSSENTTTVSFSKAIVGQPVDESLFRFTPPADAVLVERMTFGPKSSMVGRDSPELELKGVDGKPFSGADLLSRTLLLQFGPDSDDDSLLLLEMTYRSLKGNGLTAIYVVPSRNQRRVGSEGYTVPIAIDSDGKVAKQFGITYKGTVLIDRLGKIVYIDTLSRNSLELTRALQKTGVW
ncbi:MAG TPA: hypothetical protein VGK29_21975 [Paludibaculum sp.]|jgi:outer membrane lipoprotein-sorting protein